MQYLRAANIVIGHANFPAATTAYDDIIRLIHDRASSAVDPGRCLHNRPPGGQKPWCPLPLKSADVRFNPPRWWCVPLQLARIEGPSGAACDLGAARPTVRTGSLTQIRIDGGQNALARRSTRAIKHSRPGQRALSEGNLRRRRTHGHHGQKSRPLTAARLVHDKPSPALACTSRDRLRTRNEGNDPVDEGTFASYRRLRELLG